MRIKVKEETADMARKAYHVCLECYHYFSWSEGIRPRKRRGGGRCDLSGERVGPITRACSKFEPIFPDQEEDTVLKEGGETDNG